MAEFRVLGPVEVWTGGHLVDTGQPRQRHVLAALLADAGRSVTWETLIDRVWGHQPPEGVRGAMRAHVSRIRRVLEQASRVDEVPVVLTRRGGGYALDVDPDRVDLHRLRNLADRARAADRAPADRAALLREAIGLWRGEPLSGLIGEWPARMRVVWRQEHLDIVVAWARAELSTGNAAATIGPLTDLAGEYPLVESIAVVLVRALHETGRTGDALAHYAKTRRRLIEELGADPSAELQSAHQAILRGDRDRDRDGDGDRGGRGAGDPFAARAATPIPTSPAADGPIPTSPVATSPAADGAVADGAARATPAMLPLDGYGFVGRGDQLAFLDAVLLKKADQPTAVIICAISGTAGVGKTALAVHWAHRVRDDFPDGQLYVNLRGFDPGAAATTAVEAVRGFLHALAVPPDRIPTNLDAQTALYRSTLADRRVLIVLDNARDAEQVRPLLPGSPDCLVVVTSRNQLAGLVANEGAHPLPLDLLSTTEAYSLLNRRIGTGRVAAEQRAADEIIIRCARLPLALAIVAARAATQPTFALAALAAELRNSAGRLDALDGGDPSVDARAVLSWSYHTLRPAAARMFRLLGLCAGPDVTAPAAASLAGVPLARARALLADLAGSNLLTTHQPGRYAFHDLLRTYAAELAHLHDTDGERDAARHRMLDHYLHTAYAGYRLLRPHRLTPAIPLDPPCAGVEVTDHADDTEAMAWFLAEHEVLLATVIQAAQTGFDRYAWQLAASLITFLDRRGLWHDQIATQQAALAAARRLANQPVQAQAHRNLAVAYARLGRHADARTHYTRALDLCGELGDDIGRAQCHLNMTWLFEREGRLPDALHQAEQALHLYREIGHVNGQARALNSVGWHHALLGNYRRGLDFCQQALGLQQQIGDRTAEAGTWDSLGYIHHHLGNHPEGIACYWRALAMFTELGDRYDEATTLTNLGDAYQVTGARHDARRAWQHALDILTELEHPDVDKVRGRLQLTDVN